MPSWRWPSHGRPAAHRAPFTGIAGIGTVNVGDYLKDGADIVNIEDMEAIFVDFRLPERFRPRSGGPARVVDIDALPGASSPRWCRRSTLVDANGRSIACAAASTTVSCSCAPHVRAHHGGVRRKGERACRAEEAIVPQGGRQSVSADRRRRKGTYVAQRAEVR